MNTFRYIVSFLVIASTLVREFFLVQYFNEHQHTYCTCASFNANWRILVWHNAIRNVIIFCRVDWACSFCIAFKILILIPTLCLKKTHKLWNGIAKNYKDQYW